MDPQKLQTLLKTCITSSKSLKQVKLLHQKTIIHGHQTNLSLSKTFINLYFLNHSFKSARQVFDAIQNPSDVTLWNTLLSSYTKIHLHREALDLFESLRCSDHSSPDHFTYPTVLKACGGLKDHWQGRKIHTLIMKSGFGSDVVVGSSLVGMYAKCGLSKVAISLFDEMPEWDVACWNTVISCYYQDGKPCQALETFDVMRGFGFVPDSMTYPTVFSACARVRALEKGREIHEELVKKGFEFDGFVSSAIVDMYGKCGCLEEARAVFERSTNKGVVSWNSIIGGYALNGDSKSCLELLLRMIEERVRPNTTTVSSLLVACSRKSNLRHGKLVHGLVLRMAIELDLFIGCSLIDLYFKCGNVEYAKHVFKGMPKESVTPWNVMVSGFVMVGRYFEALEIYNAMGGAQVQPDMITFTSALSACSQLAALEKGREIHQCVIEHRLKSSEIVMGALLDMYAKCGAVDEARHVFDDLPVRDLVSWTSMIAAYGSHSRAHEALEIFHEMRRSEVKPDGVTFLTLISVCSHAGLVDEGSHYFNLMKNEYMIEPRLEHYSCLIDLLGRAGRLDEAYNILQNNPNLGFDAELLWGMLSACSLHRNLELGEKVGELLIERDPDDPSVYIALSNMYASAGRWDDVGKLRVKIRKKGLKKKPGCSWVEVDKRIHQFFVEDKAHSDEEASDRFNINSQLEHLQAKYVGTGHADLNRFEWAVNIHRDSYASFVGHYPMLAYFAIAENESIGRERYNFMQKMLLPCGLPPEREDD
ncbi:Pentatricopeptide repeat-containing protein [Acorus gramineus]|uniref:Pentatricopeptide repeat-containing protein n=1 Tax=Acorus gramineus TaxID=55184 RepID=A0AAV9A8R1_ACOGR|nr:Pentatricopeptide repeat-containing protein [Acorus gramineus]